MSAARRPARPGPAIRGAAHPRSWSPRLDRMSVVVFLGLDGLELDAPEDDAYDLVICVATGSDTAEGTARLLESWTRAVE